MKKRMATQSAPVMTCSHELKIQIHVKTFSDTMVLLLTLTHYFYGIQNLIIGHTQISHFLLQNDTESHFKCTHLHSDLYILLVMYSLSNLEAFIAHIFIILSFNMLVGTNLILKSLGILPCQSSNIRYSKHICCFDQTCFFFVFIYAQTKSIQDRSLTLSGIIIFVHI